MDIRDSEKRAALSYFENLAGQNGPGLAALFTERGMIDDGGGGHTEGREALLAFGDSRPGGILITPVGFRCDREHRLTVYGKIQVPGYSRFPNALSNDDTSRMRWVFNFDGELIDHIVVSTVRLLPDEIKAAGKAWQAPALQD